MNVTLIHCAAASLLAAVLSIAGSPAGAESSAPESALTPMPPVLLQPKGEKVEFAPIQERCVQSGQIRFGAGERWSDCRLTRAGFVSTIGLLDFYYAHYCLIDGAKNAKACDKQAMVIFGNRAYRGEAYSVLQRIDPAGTQYEIPLVTGSGDDNLLILSAKPRNDARAVRKYYSWHDALWQPVDEQAWKRELPSRLPAGARVSVTSQPDPQSLSVRIIVADAAGHGRGKPMRVELDFADRQLFIRDVVAEPAAGRVMAHTTPVIAR